MKYLITLLAITALTMINAKELRPELPDYTIISNDIDESLGKRESKVTFKVFANQLHNQKSIRYSVDEKEYTAELNENNEFSFLTKPGKHYFMILLTTDFEEIITDTLDIEKQHHMVIRLNFKSTSRPIMVRKPVIYLYPESELAVNVTIDPIGQLFFTYPHYNNGWDVVASPNGELLIDGQTIDYLFWEAKMSLNVNTQQNSFVVPKYEAQDYITEVLDTYGLNDNEKADFLTYWIPEILQADKDNVHLQFMFNEDCSAFGELNVSPAPDRIGRIYLLWSPTEEPVSDIAEFKEVPSLDRTGFTVIEWGGAEIQLKEVVAIKD